MAASIREEKITIDPYTFLRTGLGAFTVMVGIHKILEPGIWSGYTAGWAASVVSEAGLSLNTLMQLTGVFEAVLGGMVLADRYTAIASGLIALTILAVMLNLLTGGALLVDILLRDLGLLVLAVGVALFSLQRRE